MCAYITTRTNRHDHIAPVKREMHGLPVRRRIDVEILSHAIGAIHLDAPDYLWQLLSATRPGRELRSEASVMLTVPRKSTCTYSDCTFTKIEAHLWENVPTSLRDFESIIAFMRSLN